MGSFLKALAITNLDMELVEKHRAKLKATAAEQANAEHAAEIIQASRNKCPRSN